MTGRYALRSVRVVLTPLERFAEFLRTRGKRLTMQRRLIVEQVFSHHDHFDAEELLEHLQQMIARRKVSRPTVYRTLAELGEAGLLKKMTLGGRNVYEHDYGYPQHDHLYCQSCNRLIEFHSQEIARLCARVAQEYDFEIASHRLFVIGRCAECRRQGLLPSSADSPAQNA